MIEAEEVRRRLHYNSILGVFFWKEPPRTHPRLIHEEAGSLRRSGNGKYYYVIKLDGVPYKRSRLAYAWMTGNWPAALIDHINGSSTDDRWENLRPATATENAWNHKRRAKASDLPMGVRKLGERFQARLVVNKKMFHLGCFNTPAEASATYQQARERHYGEFA